MILKIIFTDVCINILKWIIRIHTFSFPSIANLQCAPSDKQMYPQGHMYPSLGSPVLRHGWWVFSINSADDKRGCKKLTSIVFQSFKRYSKRRLELLHAGVWIMHLKHTVKYFPEQEARISLAGRAYICLQAFCEGEADAHGTSPYPVPSCYE